MAKKTTGIPTQGKKDIETGAQGPLEASNTTPADISATLDDAQRKVMETLTKRTGDIDDAISKVKESNVLSDSGRVETAGQIVQLLRTDIEKIEQMIQATDNQDYIAALTQQKEALQTKLDLMNNYIWEHSKGEKTSGSGASSTQVYEASKARKGRGFVRRF